MDTVQILYSNSDERFKHLLDEEYVYQVLRVPSTLKEYLNCVIVLPQTVSKRGAGKYASFVFNRDQINKEAIIDDVSRFGKSKVYVNYLNSYVTVTIFNNNLTSLMKSLEYLIKTYAGSSMIKPTVNISTDVPEATVKTIYCRNIMSLIEYFQLTSLREQEGSLYLDIDTFPTEFIPMVLSNCINLGGRLKVILDCSESDRKLWINRGIQTLQELNVNLDFSVLYDSVILEKNEVN